MAELLFLKPLFKKKVWGGNKIEEYFSYDLQEQNVGEAWLISGHPEGISLVDGGTYDGERLDVLWEKHPELFGNDDGRYGGCFPLLVKFIDAEDDLSIQVHPDDEYANVHENGSLGKTECWYILDCRPGTSIIIGHKAGSRREMEEMIRQGRWKDFIREIPVKKGIFFKSLRDASMPSRGEPCFWRRSSPATLPTGSMTMAALSMANRENCIFLKGWM